MGSLYFFLDLVPFHVVSVGKANQGDGCLSKSNYIEMIAENLKVKTLESFSILEVL